MSKRSTTKTIISAVEWLLFIALGVAVVAIASPLLPTKQWASLYVVVSGSMEPAIPTGSVVVVRQANTRSLQKGDVIAFTSPTNPKETITHRIVDVSHTFNSVAYTTKGDHNASPDAWTVLPEQIKGKYQLGIPYLGYLISWAKTPLGFTVVVGVPAAIIAILQIKKIRQGINEEVEKRTQATLKKVEMVTADQSALRSQGKMLSLGLISFLSLFSLIAAAKPAQALFTTRATINHVTLQVVDMHNSACPSSSLWPSNFNNPPYSTKGVTSWQNSWLNGVFNWDAFWQSMGINAPKACTIPVAPSPFGSTS